MVNKGEKTKIGLVGTGFIAKGLYQLLEGNENFTVAAIHSRRKPEEVKGFDKDLVTNCNGDLIEKSDIIVVSNGNPVAVTPVVREALEAKKPIVTMDSELQVTTGSYFTDKGYITEAEGDQPGCLAALNTEALSMGFEPIVYGNMKKYLNYNPDIDSMKYWAKKSGISMEQVTSFTDGTKVEIEQVLVANGLGADLAPGGMIGGEKIYAEFKLGAYSLAEAAIKHDIVMSDYLMCHNNSAAGVFVVAKHKEVQHPYLSYYKMGDGPYYILEKPYHLCHFEITKSLTSVKNGMAPILTNGSNPTYSVSAIAKRQLKPGQIIERGMGSFDVRGRGIAIDSNPDHVPIGLLFDVQVKREVQEGETLHFDDLILPESEALEIWKKILEKRKSLEKI